METNLYEVELKTKQADILSCMMKPGFPTSEEKRNKFIEAVHTALASAFTHFQSSPADLSPVGLRVISTGCYQANFVLRNMPEYLFVLWVNTNANIPARTPAGKKTTKYVGFQWRLVLAKSSVPLNAPVSETQPEFTNVAAGVGGDLHYAVTKFQEALEAHPTKDTLIHLFT